MLQLLHELSSLQWAELPKLQNNLQPMLNPLHRACIESPQGGDSEFRYVLRSWNITGSHGFKMTLVEHDPKLEGFV